MMVVMVAKNEFSRKIIHVNLSQVNTVNCITFYMCFMRSEQIITE